MGHYERRFDNFEEIRKWLNEEAGGVATLQMWQLRDAFGAAKLGKHVVTGIEEELAKHGIGFFPRGLGASQNDEVRVYLRSAPCGKFLDAAFYTGIENDKKLRQLASNDSSDLVDKIRRLVG